MSGLFGRPNDTGRIRPWRFIIFTYELPDIEDTDDSNDFADPELEAVEWTDSERFAREYATEDRWWYFNGCGVWDNWDGSWLIEPLWADEVSITADGYARFDLVNAE